MPPPILNTNSVILCPHGGVVSHTPNGYTSYRVDGRLPMRVGDIYLISGCPTLGPYTTPCHRVEWISGSPMLIIKGSPALTLTSIGICISSGGAAAGPALIGQCQLLHTEPTELTVIND